MKKQFVQNDNNMAVAYYRFSSHAQNEQSIDQQRELAEEYAQIHGLTIVKEYADEALSGRDDSRPQYQLLLSEIKTLKPAVLILWKTDRLGRDRYENRIKFSCHPQVIPHTRKTITVSINAIDPGKKLKVETKAGETFDFATAIPLNAEFGPVKNKGAADGLIYSGEEAIGEDGKLHIRGTAVKKGKVTIPFTVYGKKFKAVIKVKS